MNYAIDLINGIREKNDGDDDDDDDDDDLQRVPLPVQVHLKS